MCVVGCTHTYITLHYTTLHYITLHCITLHYTTLHYIHNNKYGSIWGIPKLGNPKIIRQWTCFIGKQMVFCQV